MEQRTATLGDVVEILEEFFPSGTAQSWDSVGLVTGDLCQPVTLVHLAVDPSQCVIDEAVSAGANVLFTHHPLLLRGVKSVATTSGKGKAVTSLIVGDVALYTAHTNADVADDGVNDALADALGLEGVEPLVMSEDQPLGRVGDLAHEVTLHEFAQRLANVLPPAPVGIRVAGDPQAVVRRVAVLGGAGDSEFQSVRDSGADVYVTADLRHHPVLEAREEVSDRDIAYIDAGHWATESLWLERTAQRLRERLAGQGYDVDTYVSTLCTDPWTFLVPTQGAQQRPDANGTPITERPTR